MAKLKDLETKYDFKKVEEGKYDRWIKEGYFTCGDLSKKPYTIVIPPPNITGKLHIGHVLDTTLQDIIIRRKRMMGYDALLSGLAAAPMGVGSIIGIILTGILSNKIDLKIQIFMGVIITFIGCMMFSNFNLSISMNSIMLPNAILGLGSSLIALPATTITFETIPNEKMTNASSIQNLTKNVGSAIGTSSVGVFVSTYSQIHQTYLVDKLTALNNNFADRIADYVSTFISMGMDINSAQGAANTMIYKLLQQQVALCAYMSAYKTYALIALAIILLLILLKYQKSHNQSSINRK